MEIEFEIFDAKVTVDFEPGMDEKPVGWNYATDSIVYSRNLVVELNSVMTAKGKNILGSLKSDWIDEIERECLTEAEEDSRDYELACHD